MSLTYRREIDGLRAVAVLPVILFHAGFDAFRGGFVGVDVFFVISGYLITSIVVAGLNKGTFTLAGFYERRARRILPALFLMVFVSLLLAWLWLLPADFAAFSRDMIAVATFSSNFAFWSQTGYFDTATELKPLIHTWSVAVEEQYYALFPLFVLLTCRLGTRWLPRLLVLVAIASFIAAQSIVGREPATAFFLLPTRAWELALGALTGIFLLNNPKRQAQRSIAYEVAGVVGVALIVAAVLLFDARTQVPGAPALLPTIGAVLVILFASQDTLTGRVLGHRILVGVGLVSYSAYLWHQPLFAFARHRSLGEPTWQLFLGLSVLTMGLAYLSWRFVETPCRRRNNFTRRQILGWSAIGTFAACTAGVAVYSADGFPERMPTNVQWRSLADKIRVNGPVCEITPVGGYRGVSSCSFGDVASSQVVALYGDSHAVAIQSELDRQFKNKNIKGIFIGAPDCTVVPRLVNGRNTGAAETCFKAYDNLLMFIRQEVSTVVIIARWTFALYPIEGVIDDLAFDNQEGGIEIETPRETVAFDPREGFAQTATAKRSALEHLLSTMVGTGKPVLLVYPIPELGWDIAKVNFFHRGQFLESLSTSFQLYRSRNSFVLDVFDRFEAPSLKKIRTSDLFCSGQTERCYGQVKTIPLYYDDDHVSEVGAKLVVDPVMAALPWD